MGINIGRHLDADFYPRSPRGERPLQRERQGNRRGISTHAPREGSDFLQRPALIHRIRISTHAPREGSDRAVPAHKEIIHQFLPTLPARGATL